jgi:hypothetical protein
VQHWSRFDGGFTCPESSGGIGMSGTPSAANCSAAVSIAGSSVAYDSHDNACEANPPITPPAVATLPNLPTYPSPVCGSQGLVSNQYTPNEYKCPSGGGTALTVNHPLVPGIYEIDSNGTSCKTGGGGDVYISNTVTSLAGVTFYLKGSATICVEEQGGQTISQSPYNAGSGLAGDATYDVLSDGSGTPSIVLEKTGTGGVYHVDGVIWMPNGNVINVNKAVIEINGQAIVSQWNDQSGNHTNPNVSYNGAFSPPQNELLQLTE